MRYAMHAANMRCHATRTYGRSQHTPPQCPKGERHSMALSSRVHLVVHPVSSGSGVHPGCGAARRRLGVGEATGVTIGVSASSFSEIGGRASLRFGQRGDSTNSSSKAIACLWQWIMYLSAYCNAAKRRDVRSSAAWSLPLL